MNRSRLTVVAATAATLSLLAGWGGAGRDAAQASGLNPLTAVGGPLVVAAGDIACAAGSTVTTKTCRDAATASLVKKYNPRYVFALGDEQYQTGALGEFQNAYDLTWGQFKAKTRPVPGNHEYKTSGASGYYTYFQGQTRAPGYYAFNTNGWRVYALNSNCANIDCAAETAWLERDMSANPRTCSALLMHHPLYSSGYEHGDSPEGRPFWKVAVRHHAELVLAGHDHDYERFRKMDASGRATTHGLVSFVVGTGGKSLYTTRGLRRGSMVFYNNRAGVLALKLGEHRYGWKFTSIDGRSIDSGIRSCR